MRVALVHDDLVQWGGAERMLLGLSDIFPGAPIYTALFDGDNFMIKQNFQGRKIVTSFMQKIPGWKSMYKSLLPLFPLAFEQFDFSGYDLVISQSSRFAKAIVTKPETRHICWCLTPPRFLWRYSQETNFKLLEPLLSCLRIFDRVSSARVDKWLANSKNTSQRVRQIYDQESTVVYPFIDLERFADIAPFDGGYYLVISRLNRYKRVDLAIKAAKLQGLKLKIVGVGPELTNLMELADNNTQFLGVLSEHNLSLVLAGCKALIVSAEEDFGLTPLEANALGKPVIAYRGGGALETVTEGVTGYFFADQTPQSLINALDQLDQMGYNKIECINQAKRFSKIRFMDQFRSVVSNDL